MTSDTFSREIGTIGRDLGTIARELVTIADHVTGRTKPARPRSPQVFDPGDGDDTYQLLLAYLLALVGTEVRVTWLMTLHESVSINGTLEVTDDVKHDGIIGCRLGDEIRFWLDRYEVYDVDRARCGCLGLSTVGGYVSIRGQNCPHDHDDDLDDEESLAP
jgi:hypothetical protein